MLVNFDIPKRLNKDDLLIYDGKKFVVIELQKITKDLEERVRILEGRTSLLEERLKLNIIEEIKKVVSK